MRGLSPHIDAPATPERVLMAIERVRRAELGTLAEAEAAD
jgi:xanthine dehydrogenase molybdopterin-binding subunit B